MKRLGLVLLCIAFVLPAAMADRVAGASLVTPEKDMYQILADLLPQPITAEEIVLLEQLIDVMEPWAKEHQEEWESIDNAENPVQAIFGLDLWETVDFAADEAIALIFKFTFVRQIAAGDMDKDKMAQDLGQLEALVEDENTPPEMKEMLKEQLGMLKGMVEALNKYPEANLKLFEENKEKIESIVGRFEKLTQGD